MPRKQTEGEATGSGKGNGGEPKETAAQKRARLAQERKAAKRRDRHRGGQPPYRWGGSDEVIE